MIDPGNNLPILYAGLILINVVLSALLWATQRTSLNRDLLLVWATGALSLVVQGSTTHSGRLVVIMGFASAFFVNLALARVMSGATSLELRATPYVAGLIAAVAAAATLSPTTEAFWLISLPVAMAVAAPCLVTCTRVLASRRGELTAAGLGLVLACLLFCLHNLDYPFVRDKPELEALGFTIAILIVFALSITGPAVVLERVARERARFEQLDQLKSRFFANITHELRTPLTLILAPLEDLLTERRGDPQLGADLETMYRNGMRLLRQINGLLDLAKRDAGELRLRVQQCPLQPFLAAAVSNFRPIGHRKGLEIILEPLPEELSIGGDSDKLDLVLTNLLANAVKFTPKGGQITVTAAQEGDWVEVVVKDTGIGIPEDQLERIFDRFAQVDSGTARRYEGAGIGLSLVKEIVVLHGGTVKAVSTLNEGTEFRLCLPRLDSMIPQQVRDRRQTEVSTAHARRAEDHSPVFWAPNALAGEAYAPGGSSMSGLKAIAPPRKDNPRRLMLVEDNADLQSYLARRLSDIYELTICNNAQDALKKIAERSPDLVLADVMMPEISGYQLCSMLKEDPDTANLPVILLTARHGVDRTLEGFKAGADDYVTKPFSLRELVARIEVQLKVVDATHSLAQQEKNAVLSLVATGLAHEVRNPVNAILNAARPLKEKCATVTDAASIAGADELLTVILEAAQRVDILVGDLLGVARDRPDETSYWNVGETVESTLRLLRYKHGKELAVETHMGHSELVFGKTAQLNQVVMNLVDNAMRASGPQGRVVVTTSEQDGLFQLRVQDSGKGIPSGLEERIFDPLFSTHSSPDSTGLGLYISRRIIREHSGRIWARPRCETGGAEFIVELPLRGKD